MASSLFFLALGSAILFVGSEWLINAAKAIARKLRFSDFQRNLDNITFNILSVPLDLSSTNFALKGTFIPFIKYLTMRQKYERYYYSGDIINLYYKNKTIFIIFPPNIISM